jgi:hypothetical protein
MKLLLLLILGWLSGLHARNATEANELGEAHEFVYETLVTYRWRPDGLVADDDYAGHHTLDKRPPYIWKYFDDVCAKRRNHKFADYYHSMARGCSKIDKVAEQHEAALLFVELPSFEAYKGALKHLPTLKAGQRRTLVLAGDDRPYLSHIERDILNLKQAGKLSHVFIETKDIVSPAAQALPMGYIMMYLVKKGVDTVMKHFNNVQLTHKPELVLAAWGAEWSFLDGEIEDRKKLINYLHDLEEQANRTQGTPWLKRQMIDHAEYLDRLSQYVFFLAPAGNGIQAPKLFESLLTQTIPIVTKVRWYIITEPSFHASTVVQLDSRMTCIQSVYQSTSFIYICSPH